MSSSHEELVRRLRRELLWHRAALIGLLVISVSGSVWAGRGPRYWDPLYASQVTVIDKRNPNLGTITLQLHDQEKHAELIVSPRLVTLSDVRLLAAANGEQSLTFRDGKGRVRLEIGVETSGQPKLVFLDSEGKQTWSAH
jgi:hypothetical protein